MESTDADGDGVEEPDDCDDSDPDLGSRDDDGDCDGVPSAGDCDDADPAMPAGDQDCDGIPTNSDCDDEDPSSLSISEDADCDGFAASEDCDDSDALLPIDDADCDGWPTADDCDDADAAVPRDDQDCDGWPTSSDCNDADPSMPSDDADCDGWAAEDDCDDSDPAVPATDMDCDGWASPEDCDDSDPSIYPGASEVGAGIWEDPACDGPENSLSLAHFSFVGEAAGDHAGYSVASAGDVDGDGLADIIVGAYGAGQAYLFFASTLVGGSTSTLSLADADHTFTAETGSASTGRSVAAAGDVDGDGLGDLIVGDRLYREGSATRGKAYLVLGAAVAASTTQEVDLTTNAIGFVGEYSNDAAGSSVAPAGDVDGDGLDDVLVGAMFHDDRAGKAYLILGSSISSMSTPSIRLSEADIALAGEIDSNAGCSVASAGDVDGDGLSDVIIGADNNSTHGAGAAGKAYVVLGSTLAAAADTTLDLADADFALVGEFAADNAGVSVASAGDVDGDGLDDVLVGASENDEGGTSAGKAYLVLGSSLASASWPVIDLVSADYSFVGEGSAERAGYSVASAGDVDGDGRPDVLIGAHSNSAAGAGAGKAYVVLSTALLSAASATTTDLAEASFGFTGESNRNFAGHSVASAGDVNGDGLDDLIVGAWYNSTGGSEAGKAYVVLSEL